MVVIMLIMLVLIMMVLMMLVLMMLVLMMLVLIMMVVKATSLTGPAIREVPVSAMAWQPPEQKVVWTQFLDLSFFALIIFSYFLTMMVTVMSTLPMVIESIENCQ